MVGGAADEERLQRRIAATEWESRAKHASRELALLTHAKVQITYWFDATLTHEGKPLHDCEKDDACDKSGVGVTYPTNTVRHRYLGWRHMQHVVSETIARPSFAGDCDLGLFPANHHWDVFPYF